MPPWQTGERDTCGLRWRNYDRSSKVRVMSNPYEPSPFSVEAGDSPPSQNAVEATGDATGGVIPYKNPAALTAYYLGLFGLFPCLGLVLSVPAFILGIIGLRQRKRNPQSKGSVHAWIGIIMGGVCTVCHLIGWFAIAAAFVGNRMGNM